MTMLTIHRIHPRQAQGKRLAESKIWKWFQCQEKSILSVVIHTELPLPSRRKRTFSWRQTRKKSFQQRFFLQELLNQFNGLGKSGFGCHIQRSFPVKRFGRHTGPFVRQQLHHLIVSMPGGFMEGGVPKVISGIDFRPLREQKRSDIDLSAFGRTMKRGKPTQILFLDMITNGQPALHDILLSVLDGLVNRPGNPASNAGYQNSKPNQKKPSPPCVQTKPLPASHFFVPAFLNSPSFDILHGEGKKKKPSGKNPGTLIKTTRMPPGKTLPAAGTCLNPRGEVMYS
jgi:hypothetical protein